MALEGAKVGYHREGGSVAPCDRDDKLYIEQSLSVLPASGEAMERKYENGRKCSRGQ